MSTGAVGRERGTAAGDAAPSTGNAEPAAERFGSCVVVEQKTCEESAIRDPSEAAGLQKSCGEISKGVWHDEPCPTDGVVGVCKSAAAGRLLYYKGAEDPKHDCEQLHMGGKYQPAQS